MSDSNRAEREAVDIVRINVPEPSPTLKALFHEIQQGLQYPFPMVGEQWRLRLDGCLGRIRSVMKQIQINPEMQSDQAQQKLPGLTNLVCRINRLIRSHVRFAKEVQRGTSRSIDRNTLLPLSTSSISSTPLLEPEPHFETIIDEVEKELRVKLRELYEVCYGVPETADDDDISVATGCNAPMPDVESVFPTLPTVYVGRKDLERKILTAVRTGHGLCQIESHECHKHPVAMPAHLEGALGQEIDELDPSAVLVIAKPVVIGVPRLILLSGPPGIGKSTLAHHLGRILSGEFPDGDFYIELHSKREAGLPVTAAMLIALRQKHGIGWKPATGRERDITAAYHDVFANKRNLLVLDDAGDAEAVMALMPYGSDCCVIITSTNSLLEDLSSDDNLCILAAEELGALSDEDAAYYLRSTIPALQSESDEPGEIPYPPREIGLFEVPGAVPALASYLSRGMSLSGRTAALSLSYNNVPPGVDVGAGPGKSRLNISSGPVSVGVGENRPGTPPAISISVSKSRDDEDEEGEGEGEGERSEQPVVMASPTLSDISDFPGTSPRISSLELTRPTKSPERERDDETGSVISQTPSEEDAYGHGHGHGEDDGGDGERERDGNGNELSSLTLQSPLSKGRNSASRLPPPSPSTNSDDDYGGYDFFGVMDSEGRVRDADNDALLYRIVDVCSGVPLSLQIVTGLFRRSGLSQKDEAKAKSESKGKGKGKGKKYDYDYGMFIQVIEKLERYRGKQSDPVMGMFSASFNTLPDAAQRLFVASSVFPSYFTYEDAITVCLGEFDSDGEHTLPQKPNNNAETFDLLVRSGMIRPDTSHNIGVRYRQHERFRQWSLKKLSEWGDTVPWRVRFGLLTLKKIRDAETLFQSGDKVKKADGFAAAASQLVNILSLRAMARHRRQVRLFGSMFRDVDVFAATMPNCLRGPLLARIVRGLPHTQTPQSTTEDVNLLLSLGNVFLESGQLTEAEPLFRRTLRMCDKSLDRRSLITAVACNNLAAVLHELGNYEEAEPLYERALRIHRSHTNHGLVAEALNNLGVLCFENGKYSRASELLKESILLREEVFGVSSLPVAASLNNLALVHKVKGHFSDAEKLFKQALSIQKVKLGKEDMLVAATSNMLGELYSMTDRYAEAEKHLTRALRIMEAHAVEGEGLAELSVTLHNLATVMDEQGLYTRAEIMAKRALDLKVSVLGAAHHSTAKTLNLLAGVYRTEAKYDLAEPMYRQALRIREQTLGQNHIDVATTLYNYAALLTNMRKYKEAEPVYKRALTVVETVLSPRHPRVATTLNHLGRLYAAQKRWDEAEAHYQRALKIQEAELGPEHPDLAATLNNAAVMYKGRMQYSESEELYRRALDIQEKALGPDHPNVAVTLNNLASLCHALCKYDDSIIMLERAMAIYSSHLSADHPTTVSMRNSLVRVKRKAAAAANEGGGSGRRSKDVGKEKEEKGKEKEKEKEKEEKDKEKDEDKKSVFRWFSKK